jgi:succinoglycan biosynthesis transport protein ExoP
MTTDPSYMSPTNDLRGYLNIARRRMWSILLIALLAAGGAFLASLRQTPMYDSTAEVMLTAFDPGQVLSGAYNYALSQTMPNEMAAASGPLVGEIASGLVRQEGDDGAQTGHLAVRNPTNTTVLEFTYSDASPRTAQVWSQAYADAYIKYRDGQAEDAYKAATSSLQSKLTDLQQKLADKQAELLAAPNSEAVTIQGDISNLQNQMIEVQTRIATVPPPYQGATQLVAPAPLPTSPSNPKPARDAALGLVVGLALGLGIALLREHLDDRTAGRDELGRELGAPVIAVVPKVEGWRRKKTTRLVARDAPMSVAAESYRTARANLEFLAATHGTKTIVVTSAYLGEGKSATTANLAVTLAQTGKRVVAMSCDLRKPRLHRFFGITNEPGLADLLVGWASVEQVAVRSEPSSLRVLASGSIPPNPAELLGSEQMAKLLDALREITDYIVIDTPPVLAVYDALILARLADGVIVVADAATTTRGALVQTREQLEQIGSRIIGAIYNNFDPSKSKSYSSGYYHGYYARHEPSTNGRSEAERSASGNGDLRKPVADEASERSGDDRW